MNLKEKLKLYVITDGRLRDEIESVKLVLEGGARAIQLRMKNSTTRQVIEKGVKIRKIVEDYDALLFVDDRVDVALAIEAHGVHLGPDDIPLRVARRIAPNLLIGATVHSVDEAIKAQEYGADYLGAGSVYPTRSKENAVVIGLDNLRRIVERVRIPVVAIGGINVENVKEVLSTGVDGIAVISAILAAENPREATRRMMREIEKYRKIL